MLTKQIEQLRKDTMNWKETQQDYIGQRLYWAIEGLTSSAPEDPWMKRRTNMLKHIIDKSAAIIHRDELVVGYNYYGSDETMWIEGVLSSFLAQEPSTIKKMLHPSRFSEAEIEALADQCGHIRQYIPDMPYCPPADTEYREANAEQVVDSLGITENHTVIGYEQVLEKGFSGIRDEIAQELEHIRPTDLNAAKKKMLLSCALEIAESSSKLGRRYAAEAKKLLDESDCMQDRVRLEKVIKVVQNVPEKPAQTFHEAVQSLWFAHIINTWEDGINANSIGRIDQLLYPYYKHDMEAGTLTREEAYDLLCCLWLKLYRDYDVQQAMLGGLDENGNDATNELSYLMLDVTEDLDFIRCLSIRAHKNSPERLIRRALEIVKKGLGVPFFFNDDVIIPALVSKGVSLEDARGYAAIGCVEITIPGKANPHAVSNRINMLKCLELALNDGKSLLTGKQLGLRTGTAASLGSMKELLAAYYRQAEYFIDMACGESRRIEVQNSLLHTMVYKSMLTEGCMKKGRDFNDGGAKYNYHECMAMGLPNTADSLAAIEKLVFTDHKYTLSEVVDILRQNFPDEYVRQDFLNGAPKYGNDDDFADRYAAELTGHFCTYVNSIPDPDGYGFFAQPFSYLWLVPAGEMTAASCDGRRAGENIAYSISPMQGRDHNGLTAVFNSIAKLPADKAAGCTSAIIEIDPALFTDERVGQLAILLTTAFEKGVGQVQFNVTTAETLIKAQKEPENYQNLAVRVSGFSQRFCLLNRQLQDHIIARTKHSRL